MIFDFLESGESIQTIASKENYDGLFWHAKGDGCSVYIDERRLCSSGGWLAFFGERRRFEMSFFREEAAVLDERESFIV